jgi:hypothetical protein
LIKLFLIKNLARRPGYKLQGLTTYCHPREGGDPVCKNYC